MKYLIPLTVMLTHSKVEVRIDSIKKELIEGVGSRRNVALYLATSAIGL